MEYNINWHNCVDTIDYPELCYDEYGNKIPNIFTSTGLYVTFNLRAMFDWAFDTTYWVSKIDRKKGTEIIADLRSALKRMYSMQDKAESFVTHSRRGTYDDALYFLNCLLVQAESYPQKYCQIDR